MTAPLFQIRGLEKGYGDNRVLRGLDFEIMRGECLVILGGSGSGKTVTLRHLNGLEQPDRGEVVFDGIELGGMEEESLFPLRKRMGMLFQAGALFDSMTVFDNVAFPVREHTESSEEEVAATVEERLARVRLRGIGELLPASLSGGMRKRVALARSLALDPEVVLYDEPTAGLDPRTAATIASLIERTQRDLGVTSVIVTHDLALTRRLADRFALLVDGAFVFLGTWEEAEGCSDRRLADFLAGREETDAEG